MPQNRRILLKLSGEILMGKQSHGIDLSAIDQLVKEIKEVHTLNVEVALVIGGGNIFRGRDVNDAQIGRVSADQMGMLATVINALALQEALERNGLLTRVMSAIQINEICESYIRRRAVRHLERGFITIFAAGTGNPFFSTDSAASLRAVEINADLLLKATKVDGVYDSNPETNASAVLHKHLDYDEVINQKLEVMDTTAIVLCRDNHIPIRVFNMYHNGMLKRIINNEDCGTLISKK